MKGIYTVSNGKDDQQFRSLDNGDAINSNNIRLESYSNIGFEEDEGTSPQGSETKFQGELSMNGNFKKKREESDGGDISIEKIEQVTIFEILKYARRCDFVFFVIAVFASICVGLGMPVLIVLFGDLMQDIIEVERNSTSGNIFEESMTETCEQMAYAGIATFVLSYFQIAFMTMFGSSLVHRLRETSFRELISQDIAWFDIQKTGALVSRLADDMETIRSGVSDKLALVIQYLTTAVFCLILAFVFSPKLAGILSIGIPILALGGVAMSKVSAGSSNSKAKEHAEAGFIAESTLSSIKTVVAFGGQVKALNEYEKQLERAKRLEIRKMAFTGLLIAFMHTFEFVLYAFAYWYGSKMFVDEEIKAAEMFNVVFCILMGSLSIGQLVSTSAYVFPVNSALTFITSFIRRVPKIDGNGDNGLKPERTEGHLDFENVSFAYPTRKDIKVLKDFSLTVKPGQSVALVGHSGSGKSTIVNLIQRFYEFESGNIKLDNIDIRDLNVKWLRRQIGVVSQEPVLFGCTIAENIKYGRNDVTDQEVMQAIEDANAKVFMNKLPKGLNTLVGDRGSQLSGGQKQRIAIARALVRNPKILLLDEATSALDSASEAVVQEALDKACAGRTTIIIAHRLATIKHCDVIITMEKGDVIEVGTHSELIKKHGAYAQLVKAQMLDETETTKPTIGRTKKLSEGKDEDEKVGDVSLNSQDKEEFEDVELSVPEEEIESAKKKKEEAGMLDVLRLNKPEWHLIIGSCLFSAPVGAALAFYGLLFAAVVDMFALPTNKIEDRASTLSLIFLGYAGGLALSNIMQYGFLAFSGGRLTKRLRYRSFYTILRQDMSFFDREENNVGQLTTKLAQEASLVLGAGGIRLTMVAEFVASMTTAMIIAFIYGWQLTLFLFAFIPVIMGASVIQTSAAAGFQKDDDEKGNSGGKIISESVMNIRTVQSLHLEPLFYQKYRDSLAAYLKKMLVMSHVIGLAQSISQSMFFFVMAATFRFAAWLVTEGELGPSDSLRVTFAIMFGSYAIGQAMSVMPDYDKAKHAAHSIITLLKEQPLIDNLSERGIELKEEIHEISFEDVYFCYPARKDAKILRGLNLLVEKGTTVALVGPSGCGKSTVMQLLQRFYDPDSGTISINGVDISNMTLQSLRYKLAIVSQEPTLFNASISDNIRYGSLLSNGEFDPDVTHDDVVLAAQQANIAQFIESLPEGYNTNVGEKGTQLSGGQKQRVAIARAILRKPEILLLDEATSALDSESEKVVQKALDKVRQGRTCLVIAHRLNTIQNADKIAVIENGTVVESGTHSELIAQNGLYKQYCNAQSLNHN